MRIVQILEVMSFGDAIGNHTIALHEMMDKNGIENIICARLIDKRLPQGMITPIESYVKKPGDMIIYHLSTGAELNRTVLNYDLPVIINYHNITPPEFFAGYNDVAVEACKSGLEDTVFLGKSNQVVCAIADSEFNKRDLLNMGYTCDVHAIPILMPFDDYKKKPDPMIRRKYKDGRTNILFVGRVVPNKCQEDLITAFHYYQKYYNEDSRLLIGGSCTAVRNYRNRQLEYIKKLGTKNVVYPGQISFPGILALYDLSDIFLCLSEHEGFCVPIVESMLFELPIIAYNAGAVKDTMGEGGIILDKKDPLEVAGVMDYLMKHSELQKQIIDNQKEQLARFDTEVVAKQFLEILNTINK